MENLRILKSVGCSKIMVSHFSIESVNISKDFSLCFYGCVSKPVSMPVSMNVLCLGLFFYDHEKMPDFDRQDLAKAKLLL